MSDSFAFIRQAISAAAENVYGNESEVVGTVGDDGNFLSRLSHHSAALLNDNVLAESVDRLQLFSSPNKFVSSDVVEENNQNVNNENVTCDSAIIELSATAIAKLNAYFGDDQKSDEQYSTEVVLPLWVCKILYKALKKLPIANSMEEEYETYNGTVTSEGNRQKYAPKFYPPTNQNVSLANLHEMFPGVPKKIINQVSKENGNDYNKAALHLAEQNFEIKVDSDVGITLSTIVPSHYPRTITEEEQRINELNNAIPPLDEKWYSEDEIQSVERELEKASFDQRHCAEMKTKYIGLKNAGMLGHYTHRAQEIEQHRRKLTQYRDNLRVWRTSSEECINLHEMSADRAIAIVTEKINVCREKHRNLKKLHAITGYGKTTGTSVIKPRLLNFLKSKGIEARVNPQNQGVIEIPLSNIHRRIE